MEDMVSQTSEWGAWKITNERRSRLYKTSLRHLMTYTAKAKATQRENWNRHVLTSYEQNSNDLWGRENKPVDQ